jgi:hypothetical protein
LDTDDLPCGMTTLHLKVWDEEDGVYFRVECSGYADQSWVWTGGPYGECLGQDKQLQFNEEESSGVLDWWCQVSSSTVTVHIPCPAGG